MFVGRIQPLKAPDVLLRAAAELLAARPALRDRLVVAVVGGPSGSGLAHPREPGRARRAARHRRRRALRPAGAPGRPRRLVPRRRRRRRAVVQRVLRAGRPRGAGVRHPGRRRRGRRSAHGGRRRASAASWSRATTRGAGRRVLRRPGRASPASRGCSARRRAARRALRLGRDGRRDARRSTPRRWPSAAAARPLPAVADSAPWLVSVGRSPSVDPARAARRARARPTSTRARARSSSRCPAQHKLLTTTWLVVGDHSLLVEAFVVRRARREPRGVLPAPARAQRPDVRRALLASTSSATSTSSVGVPLDGGHAPTSSTGCSAAC